MFDLIQYIVDLSTQYKEKFHLKLNFDQNYHSYFPDKLLINENNKK